MQFRSASNQYHNQLLDVHKKDVHTLLFYDILVGYLTVWRDYILERI